MQKDGDFCLPADKETAKSVASMMLRQIVYDDRKIDIDDFRECLVLNSETPRIPSTPKIILLNPEQTKKSQSGAMRTPNPFTGYAPISHPA